MRTSKVSNHTNQSSEKNNGTRPVAGMQGHLLPKLYRIQHYKQESEQKFTISLTPENPNDSFDFLPGQFNMLYVFGIGEAPISIAGVATVPGRPDIKNAIMHTIKAVGSVTNALQRMRPGDVIGLRGPFGSSWPLTETKGKDCIIVSGGLGLAPLKPAITHIINHRQDYGKVSVLIGSRLPTEMLYQEEYADWENDHNIEVKPIVDCPTCGGEDSSCWQGEVGPVTNLIATQQVVAEDTVAFLCGPEIMMWYCSLALRSRGIDGKNIYLSMERNMRCATGHCGHCQWGPHFLCKEGPVLCFDTDDIETFLAVREF